MASADGATHRADPHSRRGTHRTPLICTKVGNRIVGNEVRQDFSPGWLLVAVAASLSRLQIETIDVLLLHSPPADFDWKNFDRAPLERLREQGRIRCYGVSCRSVAAAERVIDAGVGSVLEIVYNLADRRAGELFPRASAAGYDIICRMPLAYGLLRGAQPEDFGVDDHRSQLSEPEKQWIYGAAERLSFLEEYPGGRVASALRFAFTDPAISVAVVGMHKKDHVDAAVRAAELGPLSEIDVRRIEQAVPTTFPGWN